MSEQLNAKRTLNDLRKQYSEGTNTSKRNFLLVGDSGSGKTRCAATAPAPIVHHCFDPGGWNSIQQDIEKGRVISRNFSCEDPEQPSQYAAWEKEFNQLNRDGLFNEIGTYVLDSATTFSDSLMNQILENNKRRGQIPQLQDYQQQISFLIKCFRQILLLPCTVVITGHLDQKQDETTGRIVTGMLITGRANKKLPLLFDEVYCLEAKRSSKGTQYLLYTGPNSVYNARSRMASEGLLKEEELPNLSAIMRKAGVLKGGTA